MTPARLDQLLPVLQRCEWLCECLEIAARVNAPDWWIGAGAIRDVVWGERFGHGFEPRMVKDVDLGFFDPADLSPERDAEIRSQLCSHPPARKWDAKNQAAVHLWYPRRFGVAVQPFANTEDAVATFPEYATCVAVRRTSSGSWDVAAPHGLDDLLDGVWRRNPTRVTEAEYEARLRRKDPGRLWPGVRVLR
ncbi:MAG TPA: nucleotidyltransferase family protein [Candidatus Dormibacteraeota bacterium]